MADPRIIAAEAYADRLLGLDRGALQQEFLADHCRRAAWGYAVSGSVWPSEEVCRWEERNNTAFSRQEIKTVLMASWLAGYYSAESTGVYRDPKLYTRYEMPFARTAYADGSRAGQLSFLRLQAKDASSNVNLFGSWVGIKTQGGNLAPKAPPLAPSPVPRVPPPAPPVVVGGGAPAPDASSRKAGGDVLLVVVIAAAGGMLAWWYAGQKRRT